MLAGTIIIVRWTIVNILFSTMCTSLHNHSQKIINDFYMSACGAYQVVWRSRQAAVTAAQVQCCPPDSAGGRLIALAE